MSSSLVKTSGNSALPLPAIVLNEGRQAADRFLEFFTANIRNPNTRLAYARAVAQFLRWCEERGAGLRDLKPVIVAAYVEQHPGAVPTVKQHLAAINMLFDWLVTGQVLPANPAASVRAPRYSIKKGKTPVLSSEEARRLLDSIDTSHVVGLRDRALIALMAYSFARVSAAVHMRVSDYYANGKRYWIRLHEKGGKFHEVPVHHNAESYLDEYLSAAGMAGEKNSPLFRTTQGRTRQLTKNPMSRFDAYRMIRRRAEEAGISAAIGCHTFRATGITAYLENGGTIEHAQAIAAHESPRTTKLYDRTNDAITLDEIERIVI
jgi:site-specific recombinase XerD